MKRILTTIIVLIMFTMMLCGCASKKEKEAKISDNSTLPQESETARAKITKPSTEPSTKASAEPTTKASAEPTTKPSAESTTKPSAEPSVESNDTLPEELVGHWEGTGEPEDGSSPIQLAVTVNADATGNYTFEQAGYTESYPFLLEKNSNSFTVNIPANDKAFQSCSGTYDYTDGTLTLHIKTIFKSGRTFAYTAACTKKDESQADNLPAEAAEANVDIAAAVDFIKNNESIDGMNPGVVICDIRGILGEEDDFPAVIMENMQLFYFSQGYIISYLNSNKIVTVVSAMPPAVGKTARGIGIGSTEEEVRAAYGDGINTNLSEEGKIVFGDESALLEFIFENGRVQIINLSY